MLIFSKNHKRIVLEIILLIATAITNFYLFELLKCEPLFPQNVIKIAQRKLISAKHISFKQVCRRLLYVLLRQHWFLFRKSLWNSIYARQKFNLWHYTRQWHIFIQRDHSIITSRLVGWGGLSIFRDAAWRKKRRGWVVLFSKRDVTISELITSSFSKVSRFCIFQFNIDTTLKRYLFRHL